MALANELTGPFNKEEGINFRKKSCFDMLVMLNATTLVSYFRKISPNTFGQATNDFVSKISLHQNLWFKHSKTTLYGLTSQCGKRSDFR